MGPLKGCRAARVGARLRCGPPPPKLSQAVLWWLMAAGLLLLFGACLGLSPYEVELPAVCCRDLEVRLRMLGLDVEGVRPRVRGAQLRQLLLLLLLAPAAAAAAAVPAAAGRRLLLALPAA